jgi:hypothetical protein
LKQFFTAAGHGSAHDRAMRDHEPDPSDRGWLATLRRWMRDARHVRRTLVGMAVIMVLVLLASYHEVLQDQVARAERIEEAAEAGVVKPGLPSMNAPDARSSTERTQAR